MSGVVRAKFRAVEKTSRATAWGAPGAQPLQQEEILLQAVAGPGNEEWSKYTPSGVLKMTISNPAAMERLELGKDYFIDITPAE